MTTLNEQKARILDFTAGRSPAATRYLSLMSGDPSAGWTELVGRTPITAAEWGSPVDSGTNVSIYNTSTISFSAPSTAKPAPAAVGLFDAQSGGRLLHTGWLPPLERNPIAAGYVVKMAPQQVWFQDVGVSFYPETNT